MIKNPSITEVKNENETISRFRSIATRTTLEAIHFIGNYASKLDFIKDETWLPELMQFLPGLKIISAYLNAKRFENIEDAIKDLKNDIEKIGQMVSEIENTETDITTLFNYIEGTLNQHADEINERFIQLERQVNTHGRQLIGMEAIINDHATYLSTQRKELQELTQLAQKNHTQIQNSKDDHHQQQDLFHNHESILGSILSSIASFQNYRKLSEIRLRNICQEINEILNQGQVTRSELDTLYDKTYELKKETVSANRVTYQQIGAIEITTSNQSQDIRSIKKEIELEQKNLAQINTKMKRYDTKFNSLTDQIASLEDGQQYADKELKHLKQEIDDLKSQGQENSTKEKQETAEQIVQYITLLWDKNHSYKDKLSIAKQLSEMNPVIYLELMQNSALENLLKDHTSMGEITNTVEGNSINVALLGDMVLAVTPSVFLSFIKQFSPNEISPIYTKEGLFLTTHDSENSEKILMKISDPPLYVEANINTTTPLEPSVIYSDSFQNSPENKKNKYREVTPISSFEEMDCFSNLKKLLEKEPSKDSWNEIINFIEGLENESLKNGSIDFAQKKLADWPIEIRTYHGNEVITSKWELSGQAYFQLNRENHWDAFLNFILNSEAQNHIKNLTIGGLDSDFFKSKKVNTAKLIEKISTWKNLNTFKFSVPSEETDLNFLNHLCELENLTELSLTGCNNITDISALESFNNLENLYLNCFKLKSLKSLDKLKNLRSIHLHHMHEIRDMSALTELKELKKLTLFDNLHIRNLDSLKSLIQLEEIMLINFTELEDMSGLAELKNLRYLSIDERPRPCKGESTKLKIKNEYHISRESVIKFQSELNNQ